MKNARFWGMVLGVLVVSQAYADHIFVSGDVNGTWAVDTVFVMGEIRVPPEETLVIEAGVDVLFRGYFKFIIDTAATLSALGTETDSIRFNSIVPDSNWHGLRFYFASDSSILEYCHITNGSATGEWEDGYGGGILCYDSDPMISHCLISDCFAELYGGGVACHESAPTIYNTIIRDNSADYCGGGLAFLTDSYPVLTNCLIIGNSATNAGGGIYAYSYSNPLITNCTICENINMGVYVFSYTGPRIYSSIIWNNTISQISVMLSWNPWVRYCDVQGGYSGPGNINEDPLFVDSENGDYHVQSVAGSYHGGLWYADTLNSPCIDAGDPAASYVYEPQPNGGRVNMGFEGNTPEASKTWPGLPVSGAVSGIWPIGFSPYLIQDSVWIPEDSTLVIMPGVEVRFEGSHEFSISAGANLYAFGNPTDTIWFHSANPMDGWRGLHFFGSNDSSTLEYCKLEYGRATGNGIEANGGAIRCDNSDIELRNCHLNKCSAVGSGGAIFFRTSDALIQDCLIDSCIAAVNGGAVYLVESNPIFSGDTLKADSAGNAGGALYYDSSSTGIISNNLIIFNKATAGGAVFCQTSDLQIISSTISGNEASESSAAFVCSDTSNIAIHNCIIWNNSPAAVILQNSNASVSYSDIQGGFAGDGNIDMDPQFVSAYAYNADFHLKSVVGSYHNGLWTPDALHSPCIDAGDPNSPFSNEPNPNGGRVNMGFEGDTEEASLSLDGTALWGPICGTLSAAGNPFYVIGNAWVPVDSSLIIQAGVEIKFKSTSTYSAYNLKVNYGATLQALGTAQDSIIFQPETGQRSFAGIRFENASDECRLEYCRIFHTRSTSSSGGTGVYCKATDLSIKHCAIEACTTSWAGGGIYVTDGSNVTIENSAVNNCRAGANGGGLSADNSSQLILRNIIFDNCEALGNGGGLALSSCAGAQLECITVRHCSSATYGGGIFGISCPSSNLLNGLIVDNDAGFHGGGLYFSWSDAQLSNITVANNSAVNGQGDEIRIIGQSQLNVMNSIIWGSSLDLISLEDSASFVATYSDIQSGWSGAGNLNSNPLFTNSGQGNYHVQVSSPCIDAGNPATQYNDPEDPANPGFALWPALGTIRNDMGAYGGSGASGWVGIMDNPPVAQPTEFKLDQNFPNPFNAVTVASYELRVSSHVSLRVYDTAGRLVATVVDGWRPAGTHEVTFDGSRLASGVYIYRLQAGDFHAVKKMILLK